MKKVFPLLCSLSLTIFAMRYANAVDKEKSIPCDEKHPRVVRVALGRVTVLNFPFRPKDVVPGSNAFDFKQIKNDLIVMGVKSAGHTNAVVYLEGRRCTFDLITVKSGSDDVLIVKDPKDSQYEVKLYE
jgi:hypothetical protein